MKNEILFTLGAALNVFLAFATNSFELPALSAFFFGIATLMALTAIKLAILEAAVYIGKMAK